MNIPILIFARKESERCKNKALRPFCNNLSLTAIACEKFRGRDDVYLAATGEEFEYLAELYKINYLPRPKESVLGETHADIYRFLNTSNWDAVCSYNVCCPFTRPLSVDMFISMYDGRPLKGHWLSTDTILGPLGKPLSHGENSKTRNPTRIVANNFYIADVKELIRGVEEWRYSYRISQLEALDIDTQEQFEIVQAVYNWRRGDR